MGIYTYHAKERRLSLFDPSHELMRTHQFAIGATGLVTDDIFPDRSKPITFSIITKVTAALPTGIIFEFGSAAVGVAIWFAAADGKIYAAAGDAAAADGMTLASIAAPPQAQILRVVFAVIPGSGKARLWINGKLQAGATATNGELPNGWADTGNGAVGDVEGAVTARVGAADRVTLANAAIISSVNVFQNQRPRQFFEIS